MRLRTLGRSGLRVSELCLGTMTFGTEGWGCDDETSLALVDRYVEAGGNLLDTADIYSGGRSEEICAKALSRHRSHLLVATKCTIPSGSGPNDRGSSRKHIRESCEKSLRKLGVEAIDLYQVHCEDDSTPLEETMAALDDLVRAGKVHYVGCSNYRAWKMTRAVTLAEAHGWTPFVSLQPQYSLLVRSIEREHFAACRALGVGILPWSPLAAGMLTGKITRENRPSEARLGQRDMPFYKLYFTERGFAIVDVLVECAREIGATPAALAIAWQLAKPEITSVILGARRVEQLDGTLAAAALAVPPEIQARLDEVSRPDDEYPAVFVDWLQGMLDPAQRG